MSEPKDFVAAMDSNSRKTPVRVAFVTRRTSPHVKAPDDDTVMTFPEGLFRAAVAVEVLALILVAIALLWDAPLEGLADPTVTPNPAKAPWYFLGLQELLQLLSAGCGRRVDSDAGDSRADRHPVLQNQHRGRRAVDP